MQRIIIAAACLFATCGTALAATGVRVEPNPNPAVPLAAIVRFSSDQRAATTIEVSSGAQRWKLEYPASRKPE
jgi:hypothetical protein